MGGRVGQGWMTTATAWSMTFSKPAGPAVMTGPFSDQMGSRVGRWLMTTTTELSTTFTNGAGQVVTIRNTRFFLQSSDRIQFLWPSAGSLKIGTWTMTVTEWPTVFGSIWATPSSGRSMAGSLSPWWRFSVLTSMAN